MAGLLTSGFGLYRVLTYDDEARPLAAHTTLSQGQDASSPTTATSTSSSTEAAAAIEACTNDGLGYTVSYPEGWSTQGSIDGSCAYFNPTPFTAPADSEVVVAVGIFNADVLFDDFVSQFDDAQSYEVIERYDTTVAGARALQIHYRTGAGSVSDSFEYYDVIIDRSGHILVVDTQFPSDYTNVVNDMAKSLELT